MRGTSKYQPETRRVDLPSSKGNAPQRKRSHGDVSEEHVPPQWRSPRRQHQQPRRAENVRVELTGPPDEKYSCVRIDRHRARNSVVCHDYRRDDADKKDVLKKTVAYVRHYKLSVDESWACLLAMEEVGLAPDLKVYGALIARCLELGETTEALKVLEEARSCGIAPDAKMYNELIQACNRAGMYEQVQGLYAAMHQEGIARNAWICDLYRLKTQGSANVVNVTLAQLLHSSWPEAKACLHAMKSVGLEPNAAICTRAIRTYPKERLASGARQILDDLAHAGIPADIHALSRLIAACEGIGLQSTAMELLEEGLQMGLLKPELGRHAAADIISFHPDGVLTEPTQHFGTVLFHLGPTLFNFHLENIGAHTQFIVGELNSGLRDAIARCMRGIGLAPVRGVKRDGTLNKSRLESGPTVLSWCLQYGHIDSALRVFREMMEQGFLPDKAQCSRLMSACHKSHRMKDSAEVGSAFISACAERGHIDDALNILRQVASSGGCPDAAACAALIQACGSADRLYDAKAVLETVLKSQLASKVTVCNAMILTCEAHEWIKEARWVFNEMLRIGVQPDAGSYFAIIAAYQRGNQPKEKIDRLISKAVDEGHFDPALGYVVAESETETVPILELSADAIGAKPVKDGTPRTVPPYFAQALFRYLKSLGRIDEDTQWIADDAIKARIAELISQ